LLQTVAGNLGNGRNERPWQQNHFKLVQFSNKSSICFYGPAGSLTVGLPHLAPHYSDYIKVEKSQTATAGVSHYADPLSGKNTEDYNSIDSI